MYSSQKGLKTTTYTDSKSNISKRSSPILQESTKFIFDSYRESNKSSKKLPPILINKKSKINFNNVPSVQALFEIPEFIRNDTEEDSGDYV